MSFVSYIPRSVEGLGSSLDFNSLSDLRVTPPARALAQAESADFHHKATQQFEALFLQIMLRQARQASVAASPFDSGSVRMAQSLSDEQMALGLADPGLGLAKALLDQIRNTVAARGMSKAMEHAPQHVRKFIEKISGAAKMVARESGIPEKLILSQAALESGWGRREITHADGSSSFNLFGIKAGSGWQGKVTDVTTTEYVDGQPRKLVQTFRAYESYAESLSDYARLISQNARYRGVMQAGSAEEAARQIQQAGYATDPEYASKLIAIMGYFDAGS